jgi:hypothetical protein
MGGIDKGTGKGWAGKGGDERRRAAVAPGTALQDGLERILRGNTGALILLGYDPAVPPQSTPFAPGFRVRR